MAAGFRAGAVVGLCLMAMVVVGTEAQLTKDFYDDTCPQIFDISREVVHAFVTAEPRTAASLVRLHFHDCFVQGCDGSILLNDTKDGKVVSEQHAIANNNSIRGFFVIDEIKAQLEAACPQTVSCADIVAIASRDSAVEAGLTPGYPVLLGRRDSLTPATIGVVNNSLPGPTFDLELLKKFFANVSLNEVDLVALSGAHTIGRTHCSILLLPPIKCNTTVGFDPVFHANNLKACHDSNGKEDPNKLLDLDDFSPDFFDNWYYKNLLLGHTNFISDQVLIHTPGFTQWLVKKFAADSAAFAHQFALSTIKMGNINPLTGDDGEIRLKCAFANDKTSRTRSAESLIASQ